MGKYFYWPVLLFIVVSAHSQELIRYQVNHFTPKAGLSSIYARKIIQDPFGFIWVGTEDGLNRYNGRTFAVYNKDIAGKRIITGSDIRDLLIDTLSSSLWAVNSYGGIDQINYITGNVVFHYYQNRDPETRNILLNTLAIYKRRLYIGSSRGLFVLDIVTKKISKIPFIASATPDAARPIINNLFIDSTGHLWVFCENKGVYILDASNHAVIAEHLSKEAPPGIRYYDACALPDGSILSATNMGLFTYRMNKNVVYLNKTAFANTLLRKGFDVYACAVDRTGNIWCSQSEQLVRINSRNQTSAIVRETISRAEPGWLNSVYAIYFDAGNNLWLGCQQGLAYSTAQPAPFRQFTTSAVSETKIGHAYYLFPFNDSIVYSCAQDGLYEVNTTSGAIVPIDEKKPFYHIFVDPFRRMIVANIEGTFVLVNKKLVPLERVYPVFGAIGKIVVNSHCQVGDSLLFMGTENHRGMVVWNFKKNTVVNINYLTPGEHLKENTVNGLYKDHKNRLWILGDHSISLLDLHSFIFRDLLSENTSNQNYSIFFDVCQVKNDFYVASYGAGVLVLDSNGKFKKQISVANGLSANSVYKIIPWRDSLLFVSSNNGISQIALPSWKIRKYFECDGLHGNVFEETSGGIFNQLVFVGGGGGLTRIDPSLLPDSLGTGNMFIDQVSIKTTTGALDTSNLLIEQIEVPSNVLQTTVYFSYTGFTNSERNLFAYRIKELGKDWVYVANQNFTNLIGLAPGEYHLEIMATSENDSRKRAVTTIVLTYLPKWYQTSWFKLLVLILVALLFYAFYRYRILQLKRQQQIRKDIASDLHDDIGSTLNSVRIFTHLARKEPEKNEHLMRAEESLTQASIGLRDMIWVLDDSGDSIYDVMERIKRYALPVCNAQQIQFDATVRTDGTDRPLTKTEKRNLLLMAKEAINNSIKYADCQVITVAIKFLGKRLLLMIKDDGKGFNANDCYEGKGLKNIKQRARQINAAAAIASSKEGTVMTIVQK